MEALTAIVIGALVGGAVYLLLSRHLLYVLVGFVLLSTATNLAIFLAGRIGSLIPPIVPSGIETLAVNAANPLPQALILTAIVISFGLIAFTLVLVLKGHERLQTIDTDRLQEAERVDSPAPKPAPEDIRREAA